MYLLIRDKEKNGPKVDARCSDAPHCLGALQFFNWPLVLTPGRALELARGLSSQSLPFAQVHFERTFCLACFWRRHNLRAPTSYISHFNAVPCCGTFSLQRVRRRDRAIPSHPTSSPH